MKIAVIGGGNSGKDTAAARIAARLGLIFSHGTSRAMQHDVWILMAGAGIKYKSPQSCYDDRRNHRDFWLKVGDLLNSVDPLALSRRVLSGTRRPSMDQQDVLCGCRRESEVRLALEEGLIDIVVLVDRHGVLYDEWMGAYADYTVKNHGSIDEFLGDADRVADIIGRDCGCSRGEGPSVV